MGGGREERKKRKKRFSGRSFARSRNGAALLGDVANGFRDAKFVMAIARFEEAGAGCRSPGFLRRSHLRACREGDRTRWAEGGIRMERFGGSESHITGRIRDSAAGEG